MVGGSIFSVLLTMWDSSFICCCSINFCLILRGGIHGLPFCNKKGTDKPGVK